jgi:hypothetical protein
MAGPHQNDRVLLASLEGLAGWGSWRRELGATPARSGQRNPGAPNSANMSDPHPIPDFSLSTVGYAV